MRKLFALVVAGAVLAPGLAVAQTVIQEPDKVVSPKVDHVDFGIRDLRTSRDTPTVSYRFVKQQARFGSLITTRGDFNPELAASVDALH